MKSTLPVSFLLSLLLPSGWRAANMFGGSLASTRACFSAWWDDRSLLACGRASSSLWPPGLRQGQPPPPPVSEHWPLWKGLLHPRGYLPYSLCSSSSRPAEAALELARSGLEAAQQIRLSLQIQRFLFGLGGGGHYFGLRSKPRSPA